MKSKISKIISKLVMAGVGVALIAYPGAALNGLIRFLGAALLIIGVFGIISYFASPLKGIGAKILLVLSVIAALLSIIPLAKPALIVAIFPFVIGVGLAINGIAHTAEAFTLKSVSGVWFVPMLLSLLSVAAGCFIAFYPFETVEVLVRIAGCLLIYNAVVGLYMAVTYRPPVEVNGVIDITDRN